MKVIKTISIDPIYLHRIGELIQEDRIPGISQFIELAVSKELKNYD